jgi:hypothetical protein
MLQLAELDTRRSAILKSLEERNLLTPELKKKVEAAATLTTLEDVFAPFRPKRQTRATKAIERGLTPLADWLLENQSADPADEAAKFIDAEKEVPTAADALAGARDIIAERVADDATLRGRVRKIYEEEATVSSKIMYGKEEEADAQKFRDYFEWSEPLKSIPSHRMLAIRRGEKDGFLLMRVEVPLERVVQQALPIGSNPPPKPANRSPSPWKTAASACSCHRWKPRPGSWPKNAPTKPPSGLRRKPARTSVSLAARRKAPARHRPRLPHRLQDRGARPLRQAAPPHGAPRHRRL